jgi:endonuclease/exonuclease/phosphatase family metal-dependent hydrolase
MRIAAFNVENLFDRARILNEDAPEAEVQPVLDAHAELNRIFENDIYSDADQARILELMAFLKVLKDDEGPDRGFVRIRKIRGKLVTRPRKAGQPITVSARGRASWVGWAELKTEAVDAQAMLHTAMVIRDVGADILAVVEAESRPVLKRFHEMLSKKLGVAESYRHIMVIDGNDDRGIDVGLATSRSFPIGPVTSHVDLRLPGSETPVFSRDCPVYQVGLPGGGRLHVIPNHFKSKFNDNPAKREAQAREAARIYGDLRAAGEDLVVLLGDLNDTPGSATLAPLLAGTDLREVSDHPGFTEFQHNNPGAGRGIGTHGAGRDGDKIDYILLSPALFARMTGGGIFRKGAWPGVRPPRWEVYDTLKEEHQAASDHHAIWCDIDI